MKHVRKMLLLAAAAITAVAFAAPAAAQAEGPFWYVGGEKLEGTEEFSSEAELTFKRPVGEGSFDVGPCNYGFDGNLENGAEAAAGGIYNYAIFGVCPTNLPGCTAIPSVGGLPWSLAGQEGGVDITGFSLKLFFSEGCKAFGVPSSTSLNGTLKGQWNNETACLEYENAGELMTFPAEAAVFAYGTICFTAPGALTLE